MSILGVIYGDSTTVYLHYMADHKHSVEDGVELISEIILKIESDYLIQENIRKCSQILSNERLSRGDIIDVYIALHIILEVSLNGLFRHLSLPDIKKGIPEAEITENMDKISFYHKTILFIYNSRFDFSTSLDEATKYHTVIGNIRNFCNIRNKLLHGHEISQTFTNNALVDNPLKKSLTEKELAKHIVKFQDIIEAIRFYLIHLNVPNGSSIDKDRLNDRYLNDSFIPQKYRR